jgi:uncharacterized membrane protein YdjX (TVP38/TMEM64 family)
VPRRLLVIALIVIALLLLGRTAGGELPRFTAWVQGLGPLAPLIFVLGYVVATVAFIPGSLLTLAAGAIFGIPLGTAVVFTGAVLGASAAFGLSRTVLRGPIERKVAGDARFTAINDAVAREGRRIVFLLRLSPAFPFNLMNYALGLTRVRYVDYLVASVGMLPGTLLYVYTGKIAGDVATLAGGAAPPRGAGYYAVLSLGLAATIAVTILVTRLARRALADSTGATA